jgi:putative nucleotidyltransferase with HDIG domain
MSQRDEILAGLKDVELLSSPAMGAMQMLNDPELDSDKVGRIIELDPALTTNVLRFANSAYFGCSTKVLSIKDAFVRLGMKTVSRMVYMSAASQLSPHEVRGYDLDAGALWNHLLVTAVCSDLLAHKLGITPPPATFTAALLHDIGKLVLGNHMNVDVEPILQLTQQENIMFEEAERRILGIDHAEVGAELLKQWNLPDEIVLAIRHHLEPDGFDGDNHLMVDLLHVSNIIAMLYGSGLGMDGYNYEVCKATEERLGINLKLVQSIICDLGKEVEQLAEMSGV